MFDDDGAEKVRLSNGCFGGRGGGGGRESKRSPILKRFLENFFFIIASESVASD